ncbi:HesA/MoeB/ThiF family protein [Parageobacillus thermoglucosidasius]|uniref:HesA/MoeB/ThiF family protein n=1 Tax=Parageobacillus thermoglucosidasius TaxID=1426 RepID=UPI00241EB556|nr:ThiF family adenylyltransferase [Parageobacillus thermoglucosidasius]
MESNGFKLDEYCLREHKIVKFKGYSRVLKEYPLEFIYPVGYPSFPPTVISDVNEQLLLKKHHSPKSKTLCCFGFANERWRANMTAFEVIMEAETLIAEFSPLTSSAEVIEANDDVPEPKIVHYDYSLGSILIPHPFGDMDINENKVLNGELRFSKKGYGRGILQSISIGDVNINCEGDYRNWLSNSTLFKVKIIKINDFPPLSTDRIKEWLSNKGIKLMKKSEQWILFVFNDEWGKANQYKPTWIALRCVNGVFKWVRCYIVSQQDRNVRTPSGLTLSNKKVVIVGVGALGSLIATSLAQEGVGKITIFDHDIYEPGNSIRHQGKQQLFGLPKAFVVADRILELSPLTNVSHKPFSVGRTQSIDEALVFLEELKSADLVVDSTAEHSVTHFINRLCVEFKKPFIVASVTNGAWSCEVIRYIPNISGCWGCWNINYGNQIPPGAPVTSMQFAPGCDQPTFIGGISDINIAAGLATKMIIETLINLKRPDILYNNYLVWSSKDKFGATDYSIKYLPNDRNEKCGVCNEEN